MLGGIRRIVKYVVKLLAGIAEIFACVNHWEDDGNTRKNVRYVSNYRPFMKQIYSNDTTNV